jgi:hypothetical protein
MEYPRPIRVIHQIEITTFCNLRCKYCPHPKQEKLRQQPAMHMARDTFERAVWWAKQLNGADQELALTGIGESLMHPHFVEFLAHARKKLPQNPITVSTNGILLDDALCEKIKPYRPQIYVSLHRPERGGPAIEAAKRHDLFMAANLSAASAAFDWAGQVDWYVSAPANITCEYLRSGWSVVLVDGRITTCCLDASAKGVVGHVDDDILSLTMPGTGLKPYELCKTCHMGVP